MGTRIRGLAKLNKHNPTQVQWNHNVPGWDRPSHHTRALPTEDQAAEFCERHNTQMTRSPSIEAKHNPSTSVPASADEPGGFDDSPWGTRAGRLLTALRCIEFRGFVIAALYLQRVGFVWPLRFCASSPPPSCFVSSARAHHNRTRVRLSL